ncbi:aminodeoxychorismate lyase [Sulfuriferula plumbiphila]|uniref:aminodeoxychorismate lyase n=1 Tax=Sulfuriferula plumbiphila TaxID=171865 RepID=A0A512L6K4_9PROT|nr:aminodeoxychorismate lyase [Sulfuriferula plumbiphila]BBP04845.1 aminodeoxychorismate lyase [Sulfuriferula plumbiphila]GEP30118.1 aminodeoxychorismate lyase [Sulfuriferula plumbiphila]
MILVNGVETSTLDALDRGLAYGDGIFRTLLLRDGKAVAWARQYAKIVADCTRLGLQAPTQAALEADLTHIAADSPNCVVKIIVTRGSGLRGYAVAASAQVRTLAISSPVPIYPRSHTEQGISARVCDLRLAQQPALAGIKHLNRLENVLARREWSDPQIAEGILLDSADKVIGGTMSNLFMVRADTLLTPDLSASGISGVTRERILAAVPGLGLKTGMGEFELKDLYAADAVMVCNSVIGIWQIRRLAHQHWQPHPYTRMIRTLLEQDID